MPSLTDEQYEQKHNVNDLFDFLKSAVMKKKPQNPEQYVINLLKRRAKMIAGERPPSSLVQTERPSTSSGSYSRSGKSNTCLKEAASATMNDRGCLKV